MHGVNSLLVVALAGLAHAGSPSADSAKQYVRSWACGPQPSYDLSPLGSLPEGGHQSLSLAARWLESRCEGAADATLAMLDSAHPDLEPAAHSLLRGWALVQLERYEGAEHELRRAVEQGWEEDSYRLDRMSPIGESLFSRRQVHCLLGEALAGQRRMLEARDTWASAGCAGALARDDFERGLLFEALVELRPGRTRNTELEYRILTQLGYPLTAAMHAYERAYERWREDPAEHPDLTTWHHSLVAQADVAIADSTTPDMGAVRARTTSREEPLWWLEDPERVGGGGGAFISPEGPFPDRMVQLEWLEEDQAVRVTRVSDGPVGPPRWEFEFRDGPGEAWQGPYEPDFGIAGWLLNFWRYPEAPVFQDGVLRLDVDYEGDVGVLRGWPRTADLAPEDRCYPRPQLFPGNGSGLEHLEGEDRPEEIVCLEPQSLFIDLERLRADRDGDGLTDDWERRFLLDPHRPDSDGDGLLDSEDPQPMANAAGEPTPEALAVAWLLDLLLSPPVDSGRGHHWDRWDPHLPHCDAPLEPAVPHRGDPLIIVAPELDLRGSPFEHRAVVLSPFLYREHVLTQTWDQWNADQDDAWLVRRAIFIREIVLDPQGERALISWDLGPFTYGDNTAVLRLEHGSWRIEEPLWCQTSRPKFFGFPQP